MSQPVHVRMFVQADMTSKVGEILLWFEKYGGHIHEAIRMVHNAEFGYHHIAGGGSIEVTEAVCYCPFALTLSHLNVTRDAPTSIRNHLETSICSTLQDDPRIEATTIATFFLMEQRLEAESSFWFPYIRLLPDMESMTTPLWFNDNELTFLKGTNLFSNQTPFEQTSLGLRQEAYRKQWQLGVQVLESLGESRDRYSW